RLDVVCVEVAVALAIFRSIAVQSTDNSRQNAELFSGIVPNDSDFHADFCGLGLQSQRLNLHILDSLWIELQDTEIVDRVTINGSYVALHQCQQTVKEQRYGKGGTHLLMVVKHTVAPEWT